MHEPDYYYHPFYHYPPPPPVPHTGLVGLAGGMISLATTALYGGARIARTVIEGSVWYGEHPPYHHHHCHSCHVCHVHCCPPTYECCGCCP